MRYWEKWSGTAADAMSEVVEDFNASQDRIRVEITFVNQITQKLPLAMASGNPPDVCGLWSGMLNEYAAQSGLNPLNRRLNEAGIQRSDYSPIFWDQCERKGFMWALPSTTEIFALYWNKKKLRDAGLDPEVPPASIAELDKMAERMTRVKVVRDEKEVQLPFAELSDEEKETHAFDIVEMGFLPIEPRWAGMWIYWFGGALWDGSGQVTADTPENRSAFSWYRSYMDKYGAENILKFGAAIENVLKLKSPVLTGAVAMTLQSSLLFETIEEHVPELEWAAAPFPSVDPNAWPDVTIAECEVLVIPKGAKHPDEAFEFIRYVNTQTVMEKLNLGHRKFSPLRNVSEDFVRNHPNPYIDIFLRLAQSPNARTPPRTMIWNEYGKDLNIAVEAVFKGAVTPEQAVQIVQGRNQTRLDEVNRAWSEIEEKKRQEWEKLDAP